MKIIKHIFLREFRAYFSSPLGVVFLSVFLILSGFFTFRLGQFFQAGQAELNAFFSWHPWLYLLVVPATSMRLWAEEKGSGTIELLLTLPVSLSQAVVGKFLAAWAFLGVGLLLTFPIVLTVSYLGEPDFGVILSGYVGSFLLAGAYLAIGSFTSALSSHQIVSFISGSALCLFFVLVGYTPVTALVAPYMPDGMTSLLSLISIPQHFDAILRGVVDIRDLVYFISIISLFLVLSKNALEGERK